MRVVGGGAAEDVDADTVAGAGAANAMPAVLRREQERDVATRPEVPAGLLQLGAPNWRRPAGTSGRVATSRSCSRLRTAGIAFAAPAPATVSASTSSAAPPPTTRIASGTATPKPFTRTRSSR